MLFGGWEWGGGGGGGIWSKNKSYDFFPQLVHVAASNLSVAFNCSAATLGMCIGVSGFAMGCMLPWGWVVVVVVVVGGGGYVGVCGARISRMLFPARACFSVQSKRHFSRFRGNFGDVQSVSLDCYLMRSPSVTI